MFIKSLSLAGATLALVTTFAFAGGYGGGSAPAMTAKMNGETFLIDTQKMTLYTFDKDTKDVSNCAGDCAVKWPPLTAEPGASLPKGYGLIERADGTMQVTYKGQPLYLWFKDKKPGDQTGDGVKGVWHIARP